MSESHDEIVEADTAEVLRIAAAARKRWAGALRLLAENDWDRQERLDRQMAEEAAERWDDGPDEIVPTR